MQENGSDFTLSKPTEGVKLSGAAAGGATVNGSTLWRHPLGGGRRCNVRIGSSRSAVTMNISWHRPDVNHTGWKDVPVLETEKKHRNIDKGQWKTDEIKQKVCYTFAVQSLLILS